MNTIHNPFTPKSGMEPRFFVAREKETEFFRKALKDVRRNNQPFHCPGGLGLRKDQPAQGVQENRTEAGVALLPCFGQGF